MAIEGLDKNNDGVYSREELAELAKVNIEVWLLHLSGCGRQGRQDPGPERGSSTRMVPCRSTSRYRSIHPFRRMLKGSLTSCRTRPSTSPSCRPRRTL